MVTPDSYPGTSVLVNKLDLSDFRKYEVAMNAATVMRQYELDEGKCPASSLTCFDREHLRSIHSHLFQDIFEWAGEFRDHGMRVGLCDVFTEPSQIDVELEFFFSQIKRDGYLIGADRNHFVERMALYLGWIGVIHPFSEGNGRTQRAFLQQLARHAGRKMNFQNIPTWQNLESARRFHNERVVEPLRILVDAALR